MWFQARMNSRSIMRDLSCSLKVTSITKWTELQALSLVLIRNISTLELKRGWFISLNFLLLKLWPMNTKKARMVKLLEPKCSSSKTQRAKMLSIDPNKTKPTIILSLTSTKWEAFLRLISLSFMLSIQASLFGTKMQTNLPRLIAQLMQASSKLTKLEQLQTVSLWQLDSPKQTRCFSSVLVWKKQISS